MKRLAIAVALCFPATAGGHVTVSPDTVPEGAFAVLDVRVPNESDSASTTKLELQLPAGADTPSVAPPPGWAAEVGEGTVTFSGGEIPPGQFLAFPISLAVPGEDGDTVTFKAVQTYDDGEISRWVGSPSSDNPAPTVTIGEAAATTGHHGGGSSGGGHAEHLAIAALIVGGLGFLLGGFAVFRSR